MGKAEQQQRDQIENPYRLNFVRVVDQSDGSFWNTVWTHSHNGTEIIKVGLWDGASRPRVFRKKLTLDSVETTQECLDAYRFIEDALPNITRETASFSFDVPARIIKAFCGRLPESGKKYDLVSLMLRWFGIGEVYRDRHGNRTPTHTT